ncbi:pathogenicity island protein [Staphylococcus arlettae]|uniref:pathogenicity island protein n=1 Tax=Staphylococcus arlettae TaxID=29378 RepID=UPI003CF84B93
MKSQVLIKRTIVKWFNVYRNNELIANISPDVMKELLPNANTKADLICAELDINLLKENY